MTRLDHALRLAADGFYVFPLKPGLKTPAHKGWQAEATRNEGTVRNWFTATGYNIGIFTGKYGDGGGALLVVDVDNKEGKNGDAEILRLELAEGLDLPETRETRTPTGGRHLFYRVKEPVKSGANVLGRGLDIRSRGGFVVGAGSSTRDQLRYEQTCGAALAEAPSWLVERCGVRVSERQPASEHSPSPSVAEAAVVRARRYLELDAPVAVQGAGGDETTYKVAARLKDVGCGEDDAFRLLAEHWNERCQPPWPLDDLRTKVRNAYAYGTLPPGSAAPENDFDAIQNPVSNATLDTEKNIVVLHPFDELNREFAYVIAGGDDHIIWETVDADGRPELRHISLATFHNRHAPKKITVGKKESQVSKEWLEWSGRRAFDGIVFMPERDAPHRFYNLWRGFGVESIDRPTGDATKGREMWLEHARLNVCRGDTALFSWLLGYFGHLVQRPWEKPLVALVFKGDKGVGKNALFAPFSTMLGGHYLLTAKERYLTGNFNGHLENLLMFVLDEAFWSGNKSAEGTLKDLVTGDHHVIERKGYEPYKVANLARVAIIGNEEWLVPASWDERRYAVFNVGDGRKQDTAFFGEMARCMTNGGAGALLHYLRNLNVEADVNQAPGTAGLLDQKIASLEPFQAWWLACLTDGKVVLSDFGSEWPDRADCERLRSAFRRWAKERNVRARLPDDRTIGREFKKIGVEHKKFAAGYAYVIPALAEARAAWEKYIGHKGVEWPE